VGLKRYGDMSYSAARAALLDAWRVFSYRQDWEQRQFCMPLWSLLAEECYLRGYVELPDFYDYLDAYCESKWLAQTRGRLDPIKEIQGDILEWRYGMNSLTDIAANSGKDWEEDIVLKRERETEIARIHNMDLPDINSKATVTKQNASS
jgi:capsid protein